MFDLSDRTALVTGAGQGMGLGIARALAGAGAKVYVNDLYAARAESGAADIGGYALPGDITDADTRAGFLRITGPIDILCNNAGVPEGMPGSLATADVMPEDWYERQMALNYHAVRGLIQLYVPGMRERAHGRILITSSESHRIGLPMGLTPYASAKAASLAYMRHIAAELGRTGITANALSLGTMNNFEGSERAAQSTMIGRAGSPDDVGAAALYLCSDEASWMTGQTIPLNGGSCTA